MSERLTCVIYSAHGGVEIYFYKAVFRIDSAMDHSERPESEPSTSGTFLVPKSVPLHGGKRRGSGRKRTYESGYERVRSVIWKTFSVHTEVYAVTTSADLESLPTERTVHTPTPSSVGSPRQTSTPRRRQARTKLFTSGLPASTLTVENILVPANKAFIDSVIRNT